MLKSPFGCWPFHSTLRGMVFQCDDPKLYAQRPISVELVGDRLVIFVFFLMAWVENLNNTHPHIITTYHNIFPNNLLLSLIVFSKALPNSAQPTGWPSQSQAAASSAVASSSQRQLVRLRSVGFHTNFFGSSYSEIGPKYHEKNIYMYISTYIYIYIDTVTYLYYRCILLFK